MKFKKIVATFLIFSMLSPLSVFASESDEYKYFEKLSNFAANMYIDDKYTQDDIMKIGISNLLKNNPDFLTELLKSSFEGLDEYSEFFTADEYTKYVNQINRAFYGIGVVINKKDDYVVVTKCMDDGGAKKAGIQAGDKFVRVDDKNVVGISTDKVREAIVGDLNTMVKITVLRDDVEMSFDIIRGEVRSDTVYSKVLDGNIGYIQINNFSTTTDTEFVNTLAKFDNSGVSKIILDLRDNPGGYLQSAVNIAASIIPAGIIVKTEYRQADNNMVFTSDVKNPKYTFEVLVNENTASAAEILASAMQESGVGKLIGTQTYGKAVIQQMFRLENGMAVKLTVGHYLTRNGNEINKIGIKPDSDITNLRGPIDMSRFLPLDFKTVLKIGASGDTVKAAQQRLYALGYNPGNADGEFSVDTQDAISKFQQETGLYSYGVLDITTQVKLENEVYVLDEIIDNQLMTAYKMFGGNVDNLYKK